MTLRAACIQDEHICLTKNAIHKVCFCFIRRLIIIRVTISCYVRLRYVTGENINSCICFRLYIMNKFMYTVNGKRFTNVCVKRIRLVSAAFCVCFLYKILHNCGNETIVCISETASYVCNINTCCWFLAKQTFILGSFTLIAILRKSSPLHPVTYCLPESCVNRCLNFS